MKTLIALISCHARPQYADAQRETWITQVPAGLDYRFFLGQGNREPKADEVFLSCDDSYRGLPNKVQETVRWALSYGYDYMLKIDDDVVLKPAVFASAGYNNYDFSGHINEDRQAVSAPWGFCYTLSRRAMEKVAQASLPPNNNDEVWVANTLAQHGITLHNENRYHLHKGNRQDFVARSPRPLRAPRRDRPLDEGIVQNGIAYCVFLHWLGFHATPDEVNIRTFHMLFKETQ